MGKSRKRAVATVSNSKSEKKNESTKADTPAEAPRLSSRLSHFAREFPLISATLTVGIPYGLYMLYYFVLLQRPHWVPFLNLRPGISHGSERQVLIVGTMGSGTTQVSHELSQSLKLEVGHEIVDADWHFTRDGTVSWFHGMRFFDQEVKLMELCTSDIVQNMGFHPKMFTSNSTCSHREKWSTCWERECLKRVLTEWNCVRRKACDTPFRTQLFQTRHPVRTIESLVAKFCQGNADDFGSVHPTFLQLAKALFPQASLVPWDEASCLEATALYVLEYDQMMIDAHRDGLIDAMYPIEQSSPCHVAKLAGLLKPETTVYAPHTARVVAACSSDSETGEPHNAQNPFSKKKNRRNDGAIRLRWTDFHGGARNSSRRDGDRSLERKIRKLVEDLGYTVEEDNDNERADGDNEFDEL